MAHCNKFLDRCLDCKHMFEWKTQTRFLKCDVYTEVSSRCCLLDDICIDGSQYGRSASHE